MRGLSESRGRAGAGPTRVARVGQGRADTCSLFLVTDRAGQGQGRATRVDTRPLFSITLAFTDRPSDDRVQIIFFFTKCH